MIQIEQIQESLELGFFKCLMMLIDGCNQQDMMNEYNKIVDLELHEVEEYIDDCDIEMQMKLEVFQALEEND